MKIWYETETEQLHIDGEGRLVLLKGDNNTGLTVKNNNFPEYIKLAIENHVFYSISNSFKNKIKTWWMVTKYIFKD